MLNHILSALGLPKRTEINTNQTPALRRIAGLEDEISDLVDDISELTDNVNALEVHVKALERAIAALQTLPKARTAAAKTSPKASPKRKAKP